MKYKVDSSAPIFNRWKHLAEKCERLNGIVQNDVVVTTEDIAEFKQGVQELRSLLDTLSIDTISHVIRNPIGE